MNDESREGFCCLVELSPVACRLPPVALSPSLSLLANHQSLTNNDTTQLTDDEAANAMRPF